MFYLFGRLQVDTDLQLIFGAGRAETPLPVAHGTTTGRSHQHQHAHSAYPCKNRCVWITCVNICFVALILHSTMIWICMYTVYVYLYLYLYLVISSFPAFHMWAVNHSMYRDHHPATSWPEEVQRGLLWHPWCQPGKRSVVTGPGTVSGCGQSIGWSSLPDQVVNKFSFGFGWDPYYCESHSIRAYIYIYIYSGLHHTPQGDGRELNPLVTHLFPELFDLGPKKTTQRTRRAPETNGLLGNDVTQTTQVIIFQLVFSVCRSRRWFIFKGTLWLGRAKIRCKRDNDMRYYISWRVTCLSVQLTRNLHL